MEGRGVISRDRMAVGAKVEHIPCEIQYNGSAPVSSYFVVNDDNRVKEAMLRGRLLKGERVPLPEGVHGICVLVVLCEGMMIVKGKDGEVYSVGASFHEMTEWYTDIEPEEAETLETSETSGVRRGFDVMRILKEVGVFVGCDV